MDLFKLSKQADLRKSWLIRVVRMTEFDQIIKGNIVTPDEVIVDGYIGVVKGMIRAVRRTPLEDALSLKDYTGHWIFPGVIDGQTHTGSQVGQEGLAMGTRAAAAGGVTTIVDMPYDDPEPVITAELFKQKVVKAEQEAHVDVALYATIAKQNGLDEILPMIEAGACAFKFSHLRISPDTLPQN